MTPAKAAEIADETIRFWRVRGVTATKAWQALGHATSETKWAPVRAHMVRWLLANEYRPAVAAQ